MSALEISILITIFLLVGFWEYVRSFQLRGLPVRFEHGFGIFAFIGWVLSAVSLIKIFGFIFGLLATAFVIFILQYVTHFSVGLVLNRAFSRNSDLPLAGFSILVWILAILALLLFIF